jgi:ammonia channel protein AmtB
VENLWHIISKPDNIPIVVLIILLIFFTWLSFSQAFQNDRLSEEGKD